jgi:class 3 adenylate cyclase
MSLRGVTIRVGIHRGRIRSFDEGDIGALSVAFARRVMAASREGAVLMSEAAWRDLGQPPMVVLYGEEELKGLGRQKLFRADIN